MSSSSEPFESKSDAEQDIVKTIAFVIGPIIVAVGAVGILAPAGLVWLAHRSITLVKLYVIAAFRVAFGLLLKLVASASRAPKTLRVFAFIPLASGIATIRRWRRAAQLKR